jgi:hypothetical protein
MECEIWEVLLLEVGFYGLENHDFFGDDSGLLLSVAKLKAAFD